LRKKIILVASRSTFISLSVLCMHELLLHSKTRTEDKSPKQVRVFSLDVPRKIKVGTIEP